MQQINIQLFRICEGPWSSIFVPSFGKLVLHNEDFLGAKNYILCQVSADAKIRDPALENL